VTPARILQDHKAKKETTLMPAALLMITEVATRDGAIDDAAAHWARLRAETSSDSVLYRGVAGDTLLELTALSDLSQLAKETEPFARQFDELAPFVTGDFRRQVLEFVEAPKSTDDALPSNRYIQLRHIEVPPKVFADYRRWRAQTIFDVVRRAEEVEVFLAYHSLLSTEPGVMFVSGFDVAPERYAAIFGTPEYQEIVRQAGSNYIAGGERGLYTTIYERVDHT
jgi:hypothetical protein